MQLMKKKTLESKAKWISLRSQNERSRNEEMRKNKGNNTTQKI